MYEIVVCPHYIWQPVIVQSVTDKLAVSVVATGPTCAVGCRLVGQVGNPMAMAAARGVEVGKWPATGEAGA